jgi:hypothetical protein
LTSAIIKTELKGQHIMKLLRFVAAILISVIVSSPISAQTIDTRSTQSPIHEQPVQAQPVHGQPVQAQPVHEQPVQAQPIQSNASSLQDSAASIYLNKLNKEDQGYIKERFNHDLNCISYNWRGIKDTKVYISIEISPRGTVKNIKVKSELDSNKIIKTIETYYNDTANYFKLNFGKNVICSTIYNYSSVNKTPCNQHTNDVIFVKWSSHRSDSK